MPDSPKRKMTWEGKEVKPDKVIPKGKNYLVLIGINAYQHVGRLQNAISDVKAFKEVLLDKYRFDETEIIELFDEQATYVEIDKILRFLAENIKPGDNLIIYFSGHGHYDEFLGEGYWVPVDARYGRIQDYYPYTYIIRAVKNIPSQHTFIIADSCYSGAILVKEVRDGEQEDPREKDPSRWLLASGRNEVVPDGEAGGNSPFAEQLIDTLDRYATEGLPVMSLVDKVTTATIHNARQKPIGRPLLDTGDKGGQFVFHPKRNEERDWKEILEVNSISAYQQYLATYPEGKYIGDAHWAIALLRDSKKGYRTYVDDYPAGKYVQEALNKFAHKEQEERFLQACQQGEAALRQFLITYPDGPFSDEARNKIERILDKEQTSPTFSRKKRMGLAKDKPLSERGGKVAPSVEKKRKGPGKYIIWLVGVGIAIIGFNYINSILNQTNDPCQNVVCLNGGTCVNGSCDCPEGYTGVMCEQLLVDTECKEEDITLAGGTRKVFDENFQSWATDKNQYGDVKPSPWNGYEMEAYDSYWVGSGLNSISPALTGDFIYEVWFRIYEGNPSISLTIWGSGANYRGLSLYLGIHYPHAPSFNIKEDWSNTSHTGSKKTFVESEEIPDCILSEINRKGNNRITIKREGEKVSFYVNGLVLKSIRPSFFPIRQHAIGLAGKSKVIITSVEAKVSG